MKKNLIAALVVLAVLGVRAEGEGYVYSSNAHAIVKVNTFSTNAVMIAYPACTKAVAVNDDMKWDFVVKQVGSVKIYGNKTTWNYDISVPTGCGFWYIRRDVAGDCKISWPD